jgi:NACalpha-BTF3-like transcription factor
MMKRRGNEMTEVCHDMMKDMYKVGGVSKEEMREFEENYLVEKPTAAKIRHTAKKHSPTYRISAKSLSAFIAL